MVGINLSNPGLKGVESNQVRPESTLTFITRVECNTGTEKESTSHQLQVQVASRPKVLFLLLTILHKY